MKAAPIWAASLNEVDTVSQLNAIFAQKSLKRETFGGKSGNILEFWNSGILINSGIVFACKMLGIFFVSHYKLAIAVKENAITWVEKKNFTISYTKIVIRNIDLHWQFNCSFKFGLLSNFEEFCSEKFKSILAFVSK